MSHYNLVVPYRRYHRAGAVSSEAGGLVQNRRPIDLVR